MRTRNQPDNGELDPTETSAVRPRHAFGWGLAALVLIYIALGIVAILVAPRLLLQTWLPALPADDQAKYLAATANIVLLGLGGVIALVGVALSLSRHRQELYAAERDAIRLRHDQEREEARRAEVDAQRRTETERTLRDRFVTAVNLLSDSSSVNRHAALFAIGALADDWHVFGNPDEVQVCIDVIAGYLRAPRTAEMIIPLTHEQITEPDANPIDGPRPTDPREVSVRQAGYSVIHRHLQPRARISWSDRRIDLSNAHIDFQVNLSGIKIAHGGILSFRGATIARRGYLAFAGATIEGEGFLNVSRASILDGGAVTLRGVGLTESSVVSFTKTKMSGHAALISNDLMLSGDAMINFSTMTLTDESSISIRGAGVSGRAHVVMEQTYLSGASSVAIHGARIAGHGEVAAARVSVSDSAAIRLTSANFIGEGRARFSAARVADRGSIAFDGAAVTAEGLRLGGAVIDDKGPITLPSRERLTPKLA